MSRWFQYRILIRSVENWDISSCDKIVELLKLHLKLCLLLKLLNFIIGVSDTFGIRHENRTLMIRIDLIESCVNLDRQLIGARAHIFRWARKFNLWTLACIILVRHSATSIFLYQGIVHFIVPRANHIIIRVLIECLTFKQRFQTDDLVPVFGDFVTETEIPGRYRGRRDMKFLRLTSRLQYRLWTPFLQDF